MRINFRAIVLTGLFFSFLFSLQGKAILGGSTDSADEEILQLIVGESKVFPVRGPRRVAIGNPQVADVIDVTESEIIIGAKSAGTTTLVYWDVFGEETVKIRVVVEDMNDIKRRIDNILGKLNFSEVSTKAENEEGKVLLLGRVKASQDKEIIMAALGVLKDKTLDLIQIKEEQTILEIDVMVLELNKDATNTLGLTWPGALNLAEASSPGTTTGGATSIGALFKILKWERGTISASSGTATITPDPFGFKLDMLIQEGKARILSRPRLACQSGKEAELLVGGEKPIMTTQAVFGGGTGTEVEYKEFGIKLKIKPTVTEGERIKLALNVEVSDVGTADTLGTFTSAGVATSTTAKAYPLSKRTSSTELVMNNAQTMAIGGLIKQKTEEDLRKMPWLGDVPVLGMFFRQKTTKVGGGTGGRGDTELFITITPTIVYREDALNEKVSLKEVAPKEKGSIKAGETSPSVTGYAQAVQKKITNAIYYPRQAQDAGWEGNVVLSLNIAYNGSLKGVKISQSSGYQILDNTALETARKMEPYPPFPAQVEAQELWVDVPIIYKKN